MHKTGSSAIQEELHGYSDTKFRYAEFDEYNHSLVIYPIFSKNSHEYHMFKSCGMSAVQIDNHILFLKKRLQEILSYDHRDIIISGEDISSLKKDELIDLIDYFSFFDKDIFVYAYVRKPFELVPSIISESVKAGYSDDLFRKIYYGDIFEKFIQLFPGRLHLKIYDRSWFPNKNVVMDFTHWIGVEKFPMKFVESNFSLSNEAIAIIYFLNKMINTFQGELFFRARQEFIKYVIEEFPGKASFSNEIIESCLCPGDLNYFQEISGVDLGLNDLVIFDRAPFSINNWASNFINLNVRHESLGCFISDIHPELLPRDEVLAYVVLLYFFCLVKQVSDFSKFSAKDYLEINKDVKESGMNPYIHFINYGIAEGRIFRT